MFRLLLGDIGVLLVDDCVTQDCVVSVDLLAALVGHVQELQIVVELIQRFPNLLGLYGQGAGLQLPFLDLVAKGLLKHAVAGGQS